MSTIYGTTLAQPLGEGTVGESLIEQDRLEAPPEATSRTFARTVSKHSYRPYHYVLLVYLFFYCSRIPEIVPGAHFSLVLTPILLIGLFLTGQVMTITRIRTGKLMLGFLFWMGLCVPFGAWFGGGVKVFITTIQAVVIVACMVAFIQTVRDYLRASVVIGVAMASSATLSLIIGRWRGDRVALGAAGTILGDPNTLCLYIMVGLPFLFIAIEMSSGFRRYLPIPLMIPMLLAAARTGSRAVLLFGAVGMLVFFVHTTFKQRIVVIIGSILLLLLAVFFLPQRIWERYLTYFQPQKEYTALAEAVQSAENRKHILKRSIQITAENPILGVGPGNFMFVEAARAKEQGIRASWHVSHNSYTEASSETGIPGFILFVATIVSAYLGVSRVRKRNPYRRIRRFALYTQVAMAMMAVGAFFLSMAYGGLLYAILAMCMIVPRMARRYADTAKPERRSIATASALAT